MGREDRNPRHHTSQLAARLEDTIAHLRGHSEGGRAAIQGDVRDLGRGAGGTGQDIPRL